MQLVFKIDNDDVRTFHPHLPHLPNMYKRSFTLVQSLLLLPFLYTPHFGIIAYLNAVLYWNRRVWKFMKIGLFCPASFIILYQCFHFHVNLLCTLINLNVVRWRTHPDREHPIWFKVPLNRLFVVMTLSVRHFSPPARKMKTTVYNHWSSPSWSCSNSFPPEHALNRHDMVSMLG